MLGCRVYHIEFLCVFDDSFLKTKCTIMIIQTVSAVSLKLPICLTRAHVMDERRLKAGVTSGSDPAVLLWSASVSCSCSFVPKIAALAVICRREQLKMALSLSLSLGDCSVSLSPRNLLFTCTFSVDASSSVRAHTVSLWRRAVPMHPLPAEMGTNTSKLIKIQNTVWEKCI